MFAGLAKLIQLIGFSAPRRLVICFLGIFLVMSKQSRKSRDGPFGVLSEIKGKVHASRPVMARIPKPVEEEEDTSLFQASLAGVKPLANPGLAEIALPRPSAVPRPRAAPEPEIRRPPPLPDPRDPQALWRFAYQDVTPIADSGRVDLATSAHRKPAAVAIEQFEAAVPEKLPQDPAALFRHLMRGTQPLAETGRLHLAPAVPAAMPRQQPKTEPQREAAPISFVDRLDGADDEAFLRPGLPRRVLSDLRKGRWPNQGELDMHGMARDEAREALGHFLAASLRQGRRAIRLIHGQGHGSKGREPVLKQLSKSWLSQREEILAFCQARPHEGGEGAVLVLLKAGHVKSEK